MSEYTAGQVERAAGSMRVRSSDELEVERMLLAYAATLRQQAQWGDGVVSDEACAMLRRKLPLGCAGMVGNDEARAALEAVAPLLRAPAEQGGRVDASKYLPEIAEALGDPALTSMSQVATGIRDLRAALAQNAQGEPHYWLDEATMYGSKRKEFVRQIPLYLHAERARVPGIDQLQRYYPSMPSHPGWQMSPDSTGEWVLFSDVQALLAAAPSQPEDAA